VPDGLIPYVGTIRVVAHCKDDVEATLTMDRLVNECEQWLDEDDGDTVRATQVTGFTTDISPEETLVVLKRARNALIRTRIKECFDLGRSLDEQIYYLERRLDPSFSPTYDYGRVINIAERILNRGEDPND
jgi:hypothetical protein